MFFKLSSPKCHYELLPSSRTSEKQQVLWPLVSWSIKWLLAQVKLPASKTGLHETFKEVHLKQQFCPKVEKKGSSYPNSLTAFLYQTTNHYLSNSDHMQENTAEIHWNRPLFSAFRIVSQLPNLKEHLIKQKSQYRHNVKPMWVIKQIHMG